MKCPFTDRNSSLDTMRADPFCLGKDLNLKCGHAYYAQVQLQMYVCNLSMFDFVVWTSVLLWKCHVTAVDIFQPVCDARVTLCMQYGSSCSQTRAVTDVMSEKLCCCQIPANDSDLDDDMIGCASMGNGSNSHVLM